MKNLNEIQQKLEMVIGLMSETILAVKLFRKRQEAKKKRK